MLEQLPSKEVPAQEPAPQTLQWAGATHTRVAPVSLVLHSSDCPASGTTGGHLLPSPCNFYCSTPPFSGCGHWRVTVIVGALAAPSQSSLNLQRCPLPLRKRCPPLVPRAPTLQDLLTMPDSSSSPSSSPPLLPLTSDTQVQPSVVPSEPTHAQPQLRLLSTEKARPAPPSPSRSTGMDSTVPSKATGPKVLPLTPLAPSVPPAPTPPGRESDLRSPS